MLAKIEIALHPVRAELVEAPFYSLTGRKKKSGPSTSSGRTVQSSRSKLPVCRTAPSGADRFQQPFEQRSEEHTSELQSLMRISYAVFCLKKKKIRKKQLNNRDE